MTAQNLYEMGTPLRVAYCHPDLGLGGRLPGHVRFPCLDGMHGQLLCVAAGAERLIVDAAVETVKHGHTVGVSTSHRI